MTTQSKAMRRMIAARGALVLDICFWGVLALKLRLLEDLSCKTAWVNGRTLGYNPEYILSLTHSVLKTLMAHEVGHCAYGHPWRRAGRDPDRWNEACDYAINAILKQAGFELPEGALFDPKYIGKSAEWIYNRLPRAGSTGGGGGSSDQQQQQQQQAAGGPSDQQQQQGDQQSAGSGGKQDKPQPFGGEVRDAPTDADDQGNVPSEEEWKQAVQQAATIAQGQGKLPGDMARAVAKITEPNIEWRSILMRFAKEVARSDFSWTQPNPRYIAQGLYLPGLRNEELAPFVLAVDVSGSIDNTLLEIFGGAFVEVVDQLQPRRVHVIYCSAAVHGIDTFERGELVKFNPRGSGGTDFRPVFEALDSLEEQPSCLIYLTDLRGRFPESDNGMPTLWVTPRRYAQSEVPFGELVPVEE